MKKSIIIILIILGSIVFLGRDDTKIAVYVDEEIKEEIPLKNSGYYFDKAICDGETEASWDSAKWSLKLTNLKEKTKCNLYFKSDKIVKKMIESLDTSGNCPSVNEEGVASIKTIEKDNSLVCKTLDDYGTSYYYRGNVSNNYVRFAGYYWRIVRINGDGTIRLIYDGTTIHENSDTSEDRLIGTSAYNESYDDNAYVGYMYGTPGSSSYEKTHANINDSTIKKYIDTWYENNLLNTDYEKYLADSIFCSSRVFDTNNVGTGYGKIETYYYYYTDYAYYSTLKCSQSNDRYTVLDSLGNQSLKYPIATINNVEAMFAGGAGEDNNGYYLYNGYTYWSMSPSKFYANVAAHVRRINATGKVSDSYDDVNQISYVKPVINLKPGTLSQGEGTISSPYEI